MYHNTTTAHNRTELPSQTAVSSLEKIPSAARRMGVSVSQFYRIAKRDGLRIIKVTERASAVPQVDVDTWINERINRHATAGKAVA